VKERLCVCVLQLSSFTCDPEPVASLTRSHNPLQYTQVHYMALRSSLLAKATQLGGDWTAESVGRALWAKHTRPRPRKRKAAAAE
jgi:hypothetical protein